MRCPTWWTCKARFWITCPHVGSSRSSSSGSTPAVCRIACVRASRSTATRCSRGPSRPRQCFTKPWDDLLRRCAPTARPCSTRWKPSRAVSELRERRLPYKIPQSVLVVIHTAALDVLLIERADHPGFWQSVTGSKDRLDEPLAETAVREVAEETGIVIGSALVPRSALSDWQYSIEYEIYPE